jgi:hypothetical protein
MINKDFYDHQNPYNKSLRNLDDRVEQFDRRYFELAENIAEIDLIDTPNDFCPERMSNGEYRYMDCRTHRPYKMMSYGTFAEEALRLWMESKLTDVIFYTPKCALLDVLCKSVNAPTRPKNIPLLDSPKILLQNPYPNKNFK